MSSSPTNVGTRSKANLSVVSIIKSTANIRNSTNEKLGRFTAIISGVDNVTKDVVTCASPRSLPTVANSDLLYKSIPSPLCMSASQIPPLAPTRSVPPTLPVSCGLFEQQLNPFAVNYSITSNPLSHIKTLTNSVTRPVMKINISHLQPKTSYVNIRPAPKVTSKYSSSVITCSLSSINTPTVNNSITNSTTVVSTSTDVSLPMTTNHFQTSVFVGTKNNIDSESKMKSNKLATTGALLNSVVLNTKIEPNQEGSELNGLNARLPAIFVPKGWNRILENGQITYIR